MTCQDVIGLNKILSIILKLVRTRQKAFPKSILSR